MWFSRMNSPQACVSARTWSLNSCDEAESETVMSCFASCSFTSCRERIAAQRSRSSVRGSPRLWRYPILLPSQADRDRVFLDFWKQGLGASRLYGATLSELPHVRSLVSSGKETNARDLARRLLALPLHSDVRSSDLERMRTALSRLASRPEFLAAQPLRS